MKQISLFLLISALLFASCIQDEAPNVEAAVDGCSGDGIYSLTIDNLSKTIEIYVLDDDNQQELLFTLPEGATIQAATSALGDNPPVYDFSENTIRTFVVTAENGLTTSTYRVRLNKLVLPTRYNFETLKQTTPYHIAYVTGEAGIIEWASGNPGFQLTGMAQTPPPENAPIPEDYPTVQIMEGYQGRGMRLQTKDTGSFGQKINMPIAAGNLFIGSFDLANAVGAPLESTHFGFPFTQMPVRMTGWYKYQSGGQTEMLDAGTPVVRDDTGDFYAVLYEAPTSDYSLDGDLFPIDGRPQNEHIVLVARIAKTETTDKWTRFELPFESVPGKTVDRQALAEGRYKLAIVFSSSIQGAYFRGAIGSTLWIDEVEIECENPNNEQQ